VRHCCIPSAETYTFMYLYNTVVAIRTHSKKGLDAPELAVDCSRPPLILKRGPWERVLRGALI